MATAFAQRTHAPRFEPSAEPNVIPFIDVLLVLLIIFMVTAPKPTTDLRVDLPRPGIATPIVIPPTIVDLKPGAGGSRAFIGAEEIALDQLGQRALQIVLAADPSLAPEDAYAEAHIFVRADLDVAYQDVVEIVERLQAAHFRKVAILAQRADGGVAAN